MSCDDGKDANVKRVQLTFDDIIRSIEVEYDGTSVTSQPRGTVGTKTDGFTLDPDEYMTEVVFKTNKRTYGPYGSNTSYLCSVVNNAHEDNRIVGLNTDSCPQKLEARREELGVDQWDDGGDHNGVTMVHIVSYLTKKELKVICGIQFGYVKNGQSKEGPFHGVTKGYDAVKETILIHHPDTYIISVDYWYTYQYTDTIHRIKVQTNRNTYFFGNHVSDLGFCAKYSLRVEGMKIVGFYGSADKIRVMSLGAYFAPISKGTGVNSTDSCPQKLNAQRDKLEENQWDDGGEHDGVTMIRTAAINHGIYQIKFDYVRNGQSKEGPIRGSGEEYVDGKQTVIVINHPDEYIVSVDYCTSYANTIQTIQVYTNKNTYLFGTGESNIGVSEKYSLQVEGKKIVGFYGSADTILLSLGAYFAPISKGTNIDVLETIVGNTSVDSGGGTGTNTKNTDPSPQKDTGGSETSTDGITVGNITNTSDSGGTESNTDDSSPQKMEAQGFSTEEIAWDDGADHDGVTRIYPVFTSQGFGVRFYYVKNGQSKEGPMHGSRPDLYDYQHYWTINHPEEYLVSFEGSFSSSRFLKIKFTTNQNVRTLDTAVPPTLTEDSKSFLLQVQGKKIVGFHGSADSYVNSIGAYFVPI